MDGKKKGRVSREDLRFALDQADLELAPKLLRMLMDRLAVPGDDNNVEYAKLLAALTPADDPAVAKVTAIHHGHPHIGRHAAAAPRTSKLTGGHSLTHGLAVVRVQVRSQASGIKEAEKKLRALLQDYDRKDAGRVARRELRICLEELGLDLTADEVGR